MESLGVPLSVLDLATVAEGSGVGEALQRSTELAIRVERLGYARYWVAEHHGDPGIASSAPAVLIAHIARSTATIHVGSGGVMLPNHSPLVVAEQFGTLEALHPGRIDLGIGRAPGTDDLTAYALRRSVEALSANDFPDELHELLGFFRGDFPPEHPFRPIVATPGLGLMPELWLLGSSLFSAQLAGSLGLPFSFAHHFSAPNTLPALERYRASFRPSAQLERPHAMVAVSVICAETDDRAEWLAGPSRLVFVRSRTGGPRGPLPRPEVAAAHHYSASEERLLAERRASQIVGGPAAVRRRLAELLERTRADELMITTRLFDSNDRIRTYELVAQVAGLGLTAAR